LIIEPKMVNKIMTCSPITFKHMPFFVSFLRSTPNHAPLRTSIPSRQRTENLGTLTLLHEVVKVWFFHDTIIQHNMTIMSRIIMVNSCSIIVSRNYRISTTPFMTFSDTYYLELRKAITSRYIIHL